MKWIRYTREIEGQVETLVVEAGQSKMPKDMIGQIDRLIFKYMDIKGQDRIDKLDRLDYTAYLDYIYQIDIYICKQANLKDKMDWIGLIDFIDRQNRRQISRLKGRKVCR